MPRLRPTTFVLTLVLWASLLPGGCASRAVAGAAATATPMGNWEDWQSLQPFVDLAKHHVSPPTRKALVEASKLLREGRALSADRRLAPQANGVDRHWIAVARANLAALHFSVCIRGVAWRLEDAGSEGLPARRTDYSPDTKLGPGDVSVEAMLTNLDAAVSSRESTLAVQGRIARARLTAFSSHCAPNEEVAKLSDETMRADLATLVAEGHLTPDLAYLWAGVQLQEYSGAAARPFLLQAREGGFDSPSVDFTLAIIALEQRELETADELAKKSVAAFAELGDVEKEAEALFIRGEVAIGREDWPTAREHYERALARAPDHTPAILGLTKLTLREKGRAHATSFLNTRLLLALPPRPLDEQRAQEAIRRVEGLAVLTGQEFELAEICREALLIDVDRHDDPLLRAILYFYSATLDVRLGDYVNARGHAVLAKDELEGSSAPALLDIQRFLDHLDGAS